MTPTHRNGQADAESKAGLYLRVSTVDRDQDVRVQQKPVDLAILHPSFATVRRTSRAGRPSVRTRPPNAFRRTAANMQS